MLPFEALVMEQEKALGRGAAPRPLEMEAFEAATLMRIEEGALMPYACSAPPQMLSSTVAAAAAAAAADEAAGCAAAPEDTRVTALPSLGVAKDRVNSQGSLGVHAMLRVSFPPGGTGRAIAACPDTKGGSKEEELRAAVLW